MEIMPELMSPGIGRMKRLFASQYLQKEATKKEPIPTVPPQYTMKREKRRKKSQHALRIAFVDENTIGKYEKGASHET